MQNGVALIVSLTGESIVQRFDSSPVAFVAIAVDTDNGGGGQPLPSSDLKVPKTKTHNVHQYWKHFKGETALVYLDTGFHYQFRSLTSLTYQEI